MDWEFGEEVVAVLSRHSDLTKKGTVEQRLEPHVLCISMSYTIKLCKQHRIAVEYISYALKDSIFKA